MKLKRKQNYIHILSSTKIKKIIKNQKREKWKIIMEIMLTLNSIHMFSDRQISCFCFCPSPLSTLYVYKCLGDNEMWFRKKLLFCLFLCLFILCISSSVQAVNCSSLRLFAIQIVLGTLHMQTQALIHFTVAFLILCEKKLSSSTCYYQPLCPSLNVFIMRHNLFKFSQIFIKYFKI